VQLLIDAGSYAADLNQELLLLAEAKGHDAIVRMLIEQCRIDKASKWMGMESKASVKARIRQSAEEEEEESKSNEAEKNGSGRCTSSSSYTPSSMGSGDGGEALSASLLYRSSI
jgi:hypothetical protein